MASMLLRIKTQMLLPRQKDERIFDIDDPRIDLVVNYLNTRNTKYSSLVKKFTF